MSAEEELQTPEETKPKATRSRAVRGARKVVKEEPPVENGAVGVLTADPGSETVAESIAEPQIEFHHVAEAPVESPVVESPQLDEPGTPAPEITAEAPVTEPILATPAPVHQNGDRPRRDRAPRGERPPRADRPAADGESTDGHNQGGRGFQQRDSQRENTARPPRPERRPSSPYLNVAELEQKPIEELHELAKSLEIQGYSRIRRPDLISKLLQAQTERDGNIFGDGVLEINEDGFGFLRGPRLLPRPQNHYTTKPPFPGRRRRQSPACDPSGSWRAA